ncbi:hypothetical protein Dimus_014816 [Dionaea muscipula]
MRRFPSLLINNNTHWYRLRLPLPPPATTLTLRCPFPNFRSHVQQPSVSPSPAKLYSPFAFSVRLRSLSTTDYSRGTAEEPFEGPDAVLIIGEHPIELKDLPTSGEQVES